MRNASRGKTIELLLEGERQRARVERREADTVFRVQLERGTESAIRNVEVLATGERPLLLIDGRVVAFHAGLAGTDRTLSRAGVTRTLRVGAVPQLAESTRSDRADGVVRAPMPGRIVAIAVSIGSEVQRGALLLVIEAMKMQNEIFARGAGRVKALSVELGATVERGAPLVEIE